MWKSGHVLHGTPTDEDGCCEKIRAEAQERHPASEFRKFALSEIPGPEIMSADARRHSAVP